MTNSHPHRQLPIVRLGAHAGALTLLLLFGIGYYLCIVRPQYAARQQHLDEASRLATLQQSANNAVETESQLRRELEELRQRNAEFRQRIPALADEHQFLQAFNRKAAELDMQVLDFQRRGMDEHATHSSLRVDIKCHGTHAAMCQLLTWLKNLDRLTIVEQYTVVSDMASPRHDISISLVLIYGFQDTKANGEETHDV